MAQLKKVYNFANKLAEDLMTTYFLAVKCYLVDRNHIDSENAAIAKDAIELFSNGCLGYGGLIKRISKATGDTKENIHSMVSKYIEDFGDFEYNPN